MHVEHVVDGPDSAEDNESKAVVVTATGRDQSPVLIVEIEESLQLNPRIRPEPAVTLIRHRDMKSPTGQPRSPNQILKRRISHRCSSTPKLARSQEWFAGQQRAKKVIASTKDMTSLSKLLAEAVAAHWREHGIGPHWSEAAVAPDVVQWWTEATGMAYLGRDFQPAIFLLARKLGWIGFNTQERSLCTGRRFHRRDLGSHISKAPHEDIGYFTAAYISVHQAIHGHSPDWAQIAESTTDQHGLRLFLDADDATAQSRWIATHGWIVQRDGSIRPGKRVAAEARSRGHSMPVVDKIETPPAPGAPAPEITIAAAVG